MKSMLAFMIMPVAEWLDVTLLVHGERFENVPLLWRIPSCQWVGRLELWFDW
jgi:hypothetical protein